MRASLIVIDNFLNPFLGADFQEVPLVLPSGERLTANFTVIHEPNEEGRVMIHIPSLGLHLDIPSTDPIPASLLITMIRQCPPDILLELFKTVGLLVAEYELMSKL